MSMTETMPSSEPCSTTRGGRGLVVCIMLVPQSQHCVLRTVVFISHVRGNDTLCHRKTSFDNHRSYLYVFCLVELTEALGVGYFIDFKTIVISTCPPRNPPLFECVCANMTSVQHNRPNCLMVRGEMYIIMQLARIARP